MIEGRRKLLTITAYFYRRPDNTKGRTIVEREHRNVRFRKFLPAGPLPDGSVRQHDLIQFWADPGGLRTVRADDIVL